MHIFCLLRLQPLLALLILLAFLTLFYLLCLIFCCEDLFSSILGRTAFSLSGRAISYFLLKLGCSAGLSLAVGFALRSFFLATEGGLSMANSMMPHSAAESSKSDLFTYTSDLEDSASSGRSGSSVNKPEAPDPEPHGPLALAAPVDAEPPLQAEETRRKELMDRLSIHTLLLDRSEQWKDSIVDIQIHSEKQIQIALLADGHSLNSILAKRHQIRGFLFYPQGAPLSEKTYLSHLLMMENAGTHSSVPYKRIKKAITNFDLFL